MANADKPSGLTPIGTLTGADWRGKLRRVAFAAGGLLGLRFLYFYFTGGGGGHIQSVILAALLMGTGFFLIVVGLLADLISVNRKLLEKVDWRTRQWHADRRDVRRGLARRA